MFDNIINKIKGIPLLYIILIVIVIIIIIVVIIISVVYLIKKKHKEGYTTSLNSGTIEEKTADPLQNYVNSWINSVKNLYSSKSVLSNGEGYVESRTMKNFKPYTYLDKNPIVTGINKY